VPTIAPKTRGGAFIGLWSAVGLIRSIERAEDIGLRRPLNVVGYDEVEAPVIVVIHPRGACAEFFWPEESRFLGDAGEDSAVVAKKHVLTEPGDEQIFVAVIIEVSHGHAHPVHLTRDAGCAGNIRECSVFVVSKQLQCRMPSLLSRPIRTVREEEIGPS